MATSWRRPLRSASSISTPATPPSCSPARNRRMESAAYGHTGRCFREHTPGLHVPIRRHHRQRRPRGSQANKPGDDHDPRYRRDATSASPATVRSGTHGGQLEDHAVHVPADAGAVRRGLLRHLATPPPGFGHVPHPLAVAEHDTAPATPTSTCPYRGRAGRRRRSRSRPCACSWGADAAGGHGSPRATTASRTQTTVSHYSLQNKAFCVPD